MDFLNYIILGIYILGMIAVAFYSRKRSKSLSDYFMAGKGLGGWMTAFAYGTTYFSSVIFIGYAGNLGWIYGLAVVWIGIGNALIGSFLAWKVLAKRTKVMTMNLSVTTMPEFFSTRYDSKHLKMLSALIIFVFLLPYSASVYQGLSYLFNMVFGINFVVCVLILAILTALYLFFGGYFATALSDFVQGIIMIIGVVIMVGCVLNYETVNWGEGFKTLIDNGLGFFPKDTGNVNFIYDKTMTLISLILITSLGVWALPQTIHKFYAVRDNKAIKQATIISSLFALVIGVGAYLTGSFARFFFEGGINAVKPSVVDSIIPIVLSKALLPGFIGLIAVLVLSASMSTLSSVALTGASSLAIDFYKGYVKKDAKDKNVTLIMRFSSLGFIILSVILAINPIEAIVTMMGLSWGTLAGCFMGPYVLGILTKKITKAGAYASMIGGLLLTITLVLIFGFDLTSSGASFGEVLKAGISMSPTIGVFTMIFSLIITPLVSFFTKKPSKETVELAFAKRDIDA